MGRGEMAAEVNRIDIRFPARPENVAVARAAVASAASVLPFTLAEVEELRIAVSEAVSNAVLHAYGPEGGEVEVAVEVDGGGVAVCVADRGRGIADVERARRPDFSTLEGHLGLGFAFLAAMTDELEVASEVGRGTRIRFVKRPQAEPGDEPSGDAAGGA